MRGTKFEIIHDFHYLEQVLAANDVHQVTSHVYQEEQYGGINREMVNVTKREWHVWYTPAYEQRLQPHRVPASEVSLHE